MYVNTQILFAMDSGYHNITFFIFLKLNLLCFLSSIPPEGRTCILVTSRGTRSYQLFEFYGLTFWKLHDFPLLCF